MNPVRTWFNLHEPKFYQTFPIIRTTLWYLWFKYRPSSSSQNSWWTKNTKSAVWPWEIFQGHWKCTVFLSAKRGTTSCTFIEKFKVIKNWTLKFEPCLHKVRVTRTTFSIRPAQIPRVYFGTNDSVLYLLVLAEPRTHWNQHRVQIRHVLLDWFSKFENQLMCL